MRGKDIRARIIRAAISWAVVTLVFCAAVIWAVKARAHPEYAWVEKHRNARGEQCCHEHRDCRVVPAARVMLQGYGYFLPDHNLSIPGEEANVSEDGQYWLCIWGGKWRCFFVPLNGS